MNERILNLLSLCMQAKEKGHDCFFDYAPHVQKISIRVYRSGWKSEIDSEGNVIADYAERKINFYIDGTGGEEDEDIMRETETYLKGLI